MKSVLASFLMAVVLAIGIVLPVGAIPADPNSTSIESVAVFTNFTESGDQLWFVRYNVSYTTYPDELASETFMMAIYDTDGTTLLFTRALNYYGNNIISIYLEPSEALTWGNAYVVKIMGNPTIFGVLVEGVTMATSTLGSGNWYADIEDFPSYIITQTKYLETATGVSWLTSGDVFNATGVAYYNAAIPGLVNYYPQLYSASLAVVAPEGVSYNMTMGGTDTGSFYKEVQSASTNNTLNSISAMMGIPTNWVGILLTFLLMGTLAIFAIVFGNGSIDGGSAFIFGMCGVALAVMWGWIPFGYILGITLIVLIIFTLKWFGSTAG